MYTQLYFHPVRRIYDIHLKDFLKAWLEEGIFSTEPESLLKITDNEILAAIHQVAQCLATALFVTKERKTDGSVKIRAKRINQYKPHISISKANDAVKEVDTLVQEAEKLLY